MTIHLAFPPQRRTECMRQTTLAQTTEIPAQVTCRVCLRRYLQRLALMRALKLAKENAAP
jgi:hypothetical protein